MASFWSSCCTIAATSCAACSTAAAPGRWALQSPHGGPVGVGSFGADDLRAGRSHLRMAAHAGLDGRGLAATNAGRAQRRTWPGKSNRFAGRREEESSGESGANETNSTAHPTLHPHPTLHTPAGFFGRRVPPAGGRSLDAHWHWRRVCRRRFRPTRPNCRNCATSWPGIRPPRSVTCDCGRPFAADLAWCC